ncbi:MAG TPA: uroporphyrinogen-III synthase [Bacteroidia bacterium]|nr:uroporphyrinogen-III synthase [Bacteroidia bacterium]MBP7260864.1 uroporphyrinogen-III synthase [Bacteroidia bacterium]MBP9179077.1 uroporphyrinogen-III synthase [Bacteroidia bacterium]MBP9725085.1 uroporphyrinogen-III synthase [Bacteroidia bacterium]HLP33565.1 uroporphyrinogen-III synthase [Bacteroidia bacterium]
MKVKSILISQPKPAEGEKSPYLELAKKLNLKVDFRPFITIDPIPAKEFKSQKTNLLDFTAIILNSRNAVDNFFRLCGELKIEMPPETKYFCINEGTANYLQKYIQVRKRKVFHGKGTETDLLDVIKNHPGEKYLFPCSNVRKDVIPAFMAKKKFAFKEAIIYNTNSADLSDLSDVKYDILVFFSPVDIKSLFDNFPHFEQDNTRIAAFGAATGKAIEDAKLLTNIIAPTKEAPSMVMALEQYIIKANKG